jgi:myo-inositol-1(or 4)-monophosphatase
LSPVIDILKQLRQLITTAGREELLPRFENTTFTFKQDGSFLTEADLSVQNRLLLSLAEHFPDIPMLGEEMTEQQQTDIIQGSERFWCLDPLDGTSNFASGIPFFSVSLALIENGQPLIGIVYDPTRDECFTAAAGQGAWINDHILNTSTVAHNTLKPCSAIVDFKRLSPELAAKIATGAPYSSQRSFGSVALDWAWLAAGRGQVYLHGKQKLWDYAAGWLILKEAGGQSSNLEGDPAFHAELKPRSAVAASTPELHQQWYNWLHA